ncbi:hypothetical protein KC352_g11 [Hortaea werneckii]|nr:hypothetical protein KC352_g11 [Hortaea werneckii]
MSQARLSVAAVQRRREPVGDATEPGCVCWNPEWARSGRTTPPPPRTPGTGNRAISCDAAPVCIQTVIRSLRLVTFGCERLTFRRDWSSCRSPHVQTPASGMGKPPAACHLVMAALAPRSELLECRYINNAASEILRVNVIQMGQPSARYCQR